MKTYIYKQYRGTDFVKNLTNVVSEFSLSQEINTAGSQIEIEIAQSFQDANADVEYDYLVTDDGDYIVTDQSEKIIVGSDVTIEHIPALNDKIEVWEFSDYTPTGRLVFQGLVSSWSTSYKSNSTKLIVLSYGVNLDNYLVQILPQSVVAEQTTNDGYTTCYGYDRETTLNAVTEIAQTFSVGATVDIVSMSIYLASGNGAFATVDLLEGTPDSPGAILSSTERWVTSTAELLQFTFPAPITLSGGDTYHIKISVPHSFWSDRTILVYHSNTSVYSSGALHTYNPTTGWSSQTKDMVFSIATTTGGIGNEFLSTDPSAIFKELLDNYQSLGGTTSYTDGVTVNDTDTTVSYTFKFNTYLDAVKKAVELAPSNWWWWVDPATDLAYFKPLSTEIDHHFVLGKHLQDLTISHSLEQVINTVYYSGGDDGTGENVLVNYSDPTSISTYGTWLDTPSDNRVTTSATADILAESLVNQFKDPRFKTEISILDTTYDISSIKIGEVVGFSNFNPLIDSLALQIMAIKYTPDLAVLTLDLLPPTQSKRIEDIKRNLQKQQTENNPND